MTSLLFDFSVWFLLEIDDEFSSWNAVTYWNRHLEGVRVCVCVCVRVRVDGKINPSRADPGSLHSQKTQLKTEPTWKPEHIKELICKTVPQH